MFAAAVASGCGSDGGSLTIYSGRTQSLVEPLLEQFSADTAIEIRVRYGDTAELAATILEEGDNSPADVFFAQDAGALGSLVVEDRLTAIPTPYLGHVPEAFRSPDGLWVGLSGRARTVAYNTDAVSEADLPDSILDFTDAKWKGRIGWAPTNGSFQAFVTGLLLLEGEDTAREWLEGMKANDPTDYPSNDAVVDAVGNGEVDVGFVNHYYVLRFIDERGEDFPVRNYYLGGGDAGSLVNVAGLGVLDTADNQSDVEKFIDYMLSPAAQQYFADETFEYPLIEGVEATAGLTPLGELEPPNIDLSDLADLRGTLDLLRETGVLP